MKLFLDASVLIAATRSSRGASRAIFDYSAAAKWTLLASPYVVGEAMKHLPGQSSSMNENWDRLFGKLTLIDDVVTSRFIAVYQKAKDRPVLFTAAASSDVLLTLDLEDFSRFLGPAFYHLLIKTPAEFLRALRDSGSLRI